MYHIPTLKFICSIEQLTIIMKTNEVRLNAMESTYIFYKQPSLIRDKKKVAAIVCTKKEPRSQLPVTTQQHRTHVCASEQRTHLAPRLCRMDSAGRCHTRGGERCSRRPARDTCGDRALPTTPLIGDSCPAHRPPTACPHRGDVHSNTVRRSAAIKHSGDQQHIKHRVWRYR